MESRDIFLLEAIVDFCDRIFETLGQNEITKENFLEDLDLQDMCAFRVEQIGEIVNSLSDKFKDNSPEMPWHLIVGFRNIVAHAYGSVNMELLWSIIDKDLPKLRDFCAKQIEVC